MNLRSHYMRNNIDNKTMTRHIEDIKPTYKTIISCVFITGIPGSGKSTHAKNIAKKFNLGYFSTGDFVRELVLKGDGESRMALQMGKLSPCEDLIRKIVCEKSREKEVIIDGFPRSMDQYEFILKNIGMPIIIVLGIGINEARKRLISRGREDEELIDKRLLNSSLGFVGNQFVQVVNAEQSMKKVEEDICRKIGLIQ